MVLGKMGLQPWEGVGEQSWSRGGVSSSCPSLSLGFRTWVVTL